MISERGIKVLTFARQSNQHLICVPASNPSPSSAATEYQAHVKLTMWRNKVSESRLILASRTAYCTLIHQENPTTSQVGTTLQQGILFIVRERKAAHAIHML